MKEKLIEMIEIMRDLLDEFERVVKEEAKEREAYTITEFASLVGLHPQTIWKYVKQGKLASTKLGNKILIPAGELKKFNKRAF
ncbi:MULTISPECIES: helix-turn-helix domain-containing protein [Thermodesulfobacterium]|uniref:helix-turn-helix domain-containing protein n=1 Tax=Thermodesulfobacterium TaxID=1740 RepID=UPI0003B6D42A|nr:MULTISPECIES: helix-turn-helix domain-containing protein [Thermodesulfobacterium]MBZ4682327.1 Helix-turn-helix domain [Thermodesulfobacterium sp.]